MEQVQQEVERQSRGSRGVLARERGMLEGQIVVPSPGNRSHCKDRLAAMRHRYRLLQEWVDGFASELVRLEGCSVSQSPDNRSVCRERLAGLRRRYRLLREDVARLRARLSD